MLWLGESLTSCVYLHHHRAVEHTRLAHVTSFVLLLHLRHCKCCVSTHTMPLGGAVSPEPAHSGGGMAVNMAVEPEEPAHTSSDGVRDSHSLV